MRWRFLKMDLPYLFGELVIVVLGITIAFSVEQCRLDRMTAHQERLLIDRLLQDVREDIDRWGYLENSLHVKNAALDAALVWERNPVFDDSAVDDFLTNLVNGAQRSYAVGLIASTATYDELVSTGQLNSLRNRQVQKAILDFYGANEREQLRAKSRATNYARAIYDLIPRDPEFRVDPKLGRDEKMSVAHRADDMELESLIIAERNLGRLMAESASNLTRSAKNLVEILQNY